MVNCQHCTKKGDLSEQMNYLGISLSTLVAKALNRMILNRLKPEIETILRRNQNGFRHGKLTAEQILVLRRLIEGVKSRKLPAVLTFIDFKKAFDSVHRGKILNNQDSRSLWYSSQNRRAYTAHVREDNGQSPNSRRRNGIVRETSWCATG